MDEPFASVDAQTRAGLEDLLLEIHADLGITIVLVTHDIDESVYLADRVIALGTSPGTVLEVIEVTLERPRHQLLTKETEDFLKYRHRVFELLGDPA
jgi:NitT/TauT family transport system ATP-binding protein